MADRPENGLTHDHPLDMDPFQKGNVRYEKWITFVRDAEQRLALVSQGRSPDPSHHLQSLGKENELTETEAAEANARLTELLLSQTAPPLHERIIRRFDRLADEALETFFDGDLVLWKRIIERLGVAA